MDVYAYLFMRIGNNNIKILRQIGGTTMEDKKMFYTKNKYCDICGKEVVATVKERSNSYTFKGVTFAIDERVLQCSCGEDLYDEVLDSETMKKLVSLYQERVGLSLEEIKAVRSQYALSMELFSRILGWSKATIARYESGNYLPDSTHMHVLVQLKRHPEIIEDFYKRHIYKFNDKEQKRINEILINKIQETVEKELEHVLNINYRIYEKTINSGYNLFTLDKVAHTILYFARNEVQKTKLMKLLFYADFLNFKRHLISITGLPYERLSYGPVPKDHELLLSTLDKSGIINVQYEYDNGYTFIRIKSEKTFDSSLFNQEELAILEHIEGYFKDYGSVDISNYSHEEQGWKDTSERGVISYSYAEALSTE